ncbi:hypothetical protein BDP27DRAFT_1406479 [Rhodocollybia butyracea]|uniref:Uncharacterized protein n=1 Tax=Rhodocollybia butyracea TaxID=206335 RepID=A0A9P5PEU0_9AGAR|nr:hypothetical protein BDP27DRAFT_1406479 [Rhodocollybia butyracea]
MHLGILTRDDWRETSMQQVGYYSVPCAAGSNNEWLALGIKLVNNALHKAELSHGLLAAAASYEHWSPCCFAHIVYNFGNSSTAPVLPSFLPSFLPSMTENFTKLFLRIAFSGDGVHQQRTPRFAIGRLGWSSSLSFTAEFDSLSRPPREATCNVMYQSTQSGTGINPPPAHPRFWIFMPTWASNYTPSWEMMLGLEGSQISTSATTTNQSRASSHRKVFQSSSGNIDTMVGTIQELVGPGSETGRWNIACAWRISSVSEFSLELYHCNDASEFWYCITSASRANEVIQ